MALNKEVCKRCVSDDTESYGWCNLDEEDWKINRVNCIYSNWLQDTRKDPPEVCPYQLEHAVMKEEYAEQKSL